MADVIKKATSGAYLFWCPGCDEPHQFNLTWSFDGNFVSPTISPSIRVTGRTEAGDLCCHSFVKAGRIQFLGDCTHKLKGQTVDLPPWPT